MDDSALTDQQLRELAERFFTPERVLTASIAFDLVSSSWRCAIVITGFTGKKHPAYCIAEGFQENETADAARKRIETALRSLKGTE